MKIIVFILRTDYFNEDHCNEKACSRMSDGEKASAGVGIDEAERTEEQKLHKLTLLAMETS